MLLEPLTGIMLQFIFVGSSLPHTTEEACTHHQAILDAVKAGDGQGAAETMAAHLQQMKRIAARGLRIVQPKKQDERDSGAKPVNTFFNL
jgi:DNA-binding GntR family transcriptional regulator